MKPVSELTRSEILNAMLEQGYRIDPTDAAEVSRTIQQAARAGVLTWTPNHIISKLHNAPLHLTPVETPLTTE
jgi:cobalamin biosynthesis Mg chelatase CobN